MIRRSVMLVLAALLLASGALAEGWEDVPVEQFLTAVREPRTSPYWAKMEGEVRHMEKKTRKTWRSTIEFRMNVAEDSVEAQLQFAGRERYRTRQVYAEGLAGQRVTEEVAPGGRGRAQYRGSDWNIENVGDSAIIAGAGARVVEVDGLTLKVEAE